MRASIQTAAGPPKRQRFLTGEELGSLGKVLAEADQAQLEPPAVTLAIRLLALTGCRLNEILGLSWDRIDLGKGALWLADAKAGSRAVPLGRAAVTLLSSLSGDGASPVFQAADGKPLSTSILEKAWSRLRMRAGLRMLDFTI
jgi:integrase